MYHKLEIILMFIQHESWIYYIIIMIINSRLDLVNCSEEILKYISYVQYIYNIYIYTIMKYSQMKSWIQIVQKRNLINFVLNFKRKLCHYAYNMDRRDEPKKGGFFLHPPFLIFK